MPDPGDRGERVDRPAASAVRQVLERAWRPDGYTSPSPTTYPWQWLWDSGFHAVLWAGLGDERALTELESLFRAQGADGFVPHMTYHGAPATGVSYWGRSLASTLTQPPVYGHAIRVVHDAGMEVPEPILAAATAGLTHLWAHRRRDDGLLVIVHPWESGCDDSIRWAHWMPDPFTKPTWDQTKTDLVRTATVVDGGARANPGFEVASVAFNAITAFAATELAAVTGDQSLEAIGTELADLLAGRWSPEHTTWVDGNREGLGPHPSATAPVVEAFLPLLVLAPDTGPWSIVLDQLADEGAYRGHHGLRQSAAWASTYDPDAYWRGPTWPQLDYLLWTALRTHGHHGPATQVAAATARGAARSGLAEYWNPETGHGRGAIPQSWAGLGWLMAHLSEPHGRP